MSGMSTWKCDKCELIVKAIASQVTHKCPSFKNQITVFVKQEKE